MKKIIGLLIFACFLFTSSYAQNNSMEKTKSETKEMVKEKADSKEMETVKEKAEEKSSEMETEMKVKSDKAMGSGACKDCSCKGWRPDSEEPEKCLNIRPPTKKLCQHTQSRHK